MLCLHYANASGPQCKIIASPSIHGLAATATFFICPVEAGRVAWYQNWDLHFAAHSTFTVGPAELFLRLSPHEVVLVQYLHPLRLSLDHQCLQELLLFSASVRTQEARASGER